MMSDFLDQDWFRDFSNQLDEHFESIFLSGDSAQFAAGEDQCGISYKNNPQHINLEVVGISDSSNYASYADTLSRFLKRFDITIKSFEHHFANDDDGGRGVVRLHCEKEDHEFNIFVLLTSVLAPRQNHFVHHTYRESKYTDEDGEKINIAVNIDKQDNDKLTLWRVKHSSRTRNHDNFTDLFHCSNGPSVLCEDGKKYYWHRGAFYNSLKELQEAAGKSEESEPEHEDVTVSVTNKNWLKKFLKNLDNNLKTIYLSGDSAKFLNDRPGYSDAPEHINLLHLGDIDSFDKDGLVSFLDRIGLKVLVVDEETGINNVVRILTQQPDETQREIFVIISNNLAKQSYYCEENFYYKEEDADIFRDKDGILKKFSYLSSKKPTELRNYFASIHCNDGPAVEYASGYRSWFRNGERHRDDGPAVEYANGTREWWCNGRLHREDGPALEFASGYRSWFRNGEHHRDDGPAVEYANGTRLWYLDGKELIEPQWREKVSNKLDKKVMKDSVIMSNTNFMNQLKIDGTDAGYRIAARKGRKAFIAALVTGAHKSGMDEFSVGLVETAFKSEVGSSLISVLLGMILPHAPMIGSDSRVQKVAGELRIDGMTDAGEAVFDEVMSAFAPVVAEIMKELPEEKVRVKTSFEDAEIEEEDGVVREMTV